MDILPSESSSILPPSPGVPATPSPPPSARRAFGVLFILSFLLADYVTWPFRGPIFLALVLATVLNRPYGYVVAKLGGRRALASMVTSVALVVVLLGPLGAIAGFVVPQVLRGLAFLRDQLGIDSVDQIREGLLSPRGKELVDKILAALHVSREHLLELARRAADGAQHAAQAVLAGSSEAVLHTAIMVIAFYFFLVEGDRLALWLERISPLQSRQTRDLLNEFRGVSRASILGAVLSALFQGLFATIGFLICGVPHAVFFGVLTLLTSFIPVVGTLLVWVPAVVLLWVFAHHAMAIVLLSWCVVFIVGAEHLGKPFLLRAILHGEEEMHTGLVFLSLLGGIEMFGLIGLVVGPIAIAFFLAMVRIYERDFRHGGADIVTARS